MRKYLLKYLLIVLALSSVNVYANDIESELGPDNPYVNTKTMQAARYLCHGFFALASQVTDEKVEHMAQKIAKLSSHCAKGNFHQALTDSGLADDVHLDHHPAFDGAHEISDDVVRANRPGSHDGLTRKFNLWEHQAIATHALSKRQLIR